MRRPPHDVALFVLCAGIAAGLAASVAVMSLLALRMGADTHALGLLLRMCTATLQLAGGVTSVMLLSLPVLLASSAIVHGMLITCASRRTARRLLSSRAAVTGRLQRAVKAAGLDGRVDLAESSHVEVFVHGLRRPRVLITTAALDLLRDDELDAVMQHEAHHVHRRDPLRLVCSHAAARALFPFPVVRELARQLVTATELAADRRAIGSGGRIALASALAKFLRTPRLVGAPGVALEHSDELRTAQLLDPSAFVYRPRVDTLTIARTAVALTSIALLVQLLSILPSMHVR